MKDKDFKEAIIDYLSGNLTSEESMDFEKSLGENPQYREEFESVKSFWDAEEAQPEASSAMDMKFYAMLNAQEKEKSGGNLMRRLEQWLFGSLMSKMAYSLAILTIGFFVGNTLIDNSNKGSIAEAKKETEKVRSQLVLTLLDQPSANKRLQAVNEVTKLNTVTETIIKALFSTLNNDDNVNVRLSAIEALKNYTEYPLVREGLVASIIHQKSPLVQIELADLMVLLQEKNAVKSFKELLKEKDVNKNAKEKMEESIESII